MTEREAGYAQALREMRIWLERHRQERRNPNWSEAHEEAVAHIDDLLEAIGQPTASEDERI